MTPLRMLAGRTPGRASPTDDARRGWTVLLVLALVGCASVLAAASAGAADFTWSGGAPSMDPSWSTATNWLGGSAPSGSVGTLAFPLLTSPACTATPPTASCYSSHNDVTGLSATAITIDDGGPYSIFGNPITLGAGGVTASTTGTPHGSAVLAVPMTLSASQTWTIDGNDNAGSSSLSVDGGVTGSAADTLGIALSHQGFLSVSGHDVEVGPVSISGAGTTAGYVGIVSAKLNATDGNPITLTDAGLVGLSATLGPLTSNGGQIQVGAPDGTVAVNGAVTLDGASTMTLFISHPGTTAGTDYSQLTATGAVNLANAHLVLIGPGSCPSLHPGDVDTLVTTSGTLTGVFAGVPDGSTVELSCGGSTPPRVRINYTAHAATATVVASSPADTTPPAITITTPAAGEHFAQGQSAAAAFTCSDGSGSGVATCSGPATVDTATPGTKTFTVTTSDHAGNHTSKSVDYVVDAPGGAASPGGQSSAGGATPAAPVSSSPPAGVASFAMSPKSLRVSKNGSFKYTFAATALRSGKIALKSTKKVRIGSKKRFITLAAKAFTASSGGTATVKFKLSRKNLNALRRLKQLRFVVTVAIGGKTFTSKLRLKAPKKP